jgi:ribosomal protein S18 acetylase RimI-like enzyme
MPRPAPTIILPDKTAVQYIDKLQRQNVDDLAFYPLTTLEKALEERHIIQCQENDEPAGYLWFGAIRGGKDVVIYQAAVDYDARRRHLGHGMVRELVSMAMSAGATGIRLKCASSAESNEFWQAIGFYCTRVTDGGVKRRRKINHYRTDIQTPLFTVPTVTPSDAPINLREYNKAKGKGIIMPSRFSRNHYGKEDS